MSEPLTLCKLMILSMLSLSTEPLTNTVLTDFLLTRDYASYFTLQEALHELDEGQFIRQEASHNNVSYTITPAGLESLHFFEDRISTEIQNEICQFIQSKEIPIAKEATAIANYYLTPQKRYAIHCQLRNKGVTQLELTLLVSSKEQAETICSNWEKQTDNIYMLLMDQLLY